MSKKFTIIYDTYCGWCYGAAPVFDALVATGAEVELLHRHLFQGTNAVKMSEGKGAYILNADARISALTGQEFSKAYAENVVLSGTEILDSGFAAQAAALVHHEGPEREFEVRHKLEILRYVDGVSAQDRETVIAALIELGVAPPEANRIGTQELAALAEKTSRHAAELMQRVGAQGVPTIIAHDDDGLAVVNHSAFYGRPEGVKSLTH